MVVLAALIPSPSLAAGTAVIFSDSPATVFQGADRLRAAGIEIHFYDLSARDRLKAALGRGLPANPRQAQAILQRRIAGIKGDLKRRWMAAYQAHIDARRYGVTRAPAVVFDARYIVYGVTDLVQALAVFRQKAGVTQ